MLQQKFIVQVTTLLDCDDITRFDGTCLTRLSQGFFPGHIFHGQNSLLCV
jgi:hypothetical protein